MSDVNFPFSCKPIRPVIDMAAYEALWMEDNATFKTIAEKFSGKNILPSDIVDEQDISAYAEELEAILKGTDIRICTNHSIDYPASLRDAKYPIEMFYYRGSLDFLYSPKRISIVGTRNPTEEGIRRAARLTRLLVKDGYTIVSGLARGIDTVAHKTAIETGGKTIAVIGTPITQAYPRENKELQEYIAKNFLLISQVPIFRYRRNLLKFNRLFFPERNKTMSAISQATVIVEAGETSGTLIQARAALYQGRKLFILDSCFRNKAITWPDKYLQKGAIRVVNYEDITNALGN